MIVTAGYLVENSDAIVEKFDNLDEAYLYETDSQFDAEWTNFEKVCESVSVLQESGIITEAFKDTKFAQFFINAWEKLKEWWGKVKAAIKQFFTEKIVGVFGKKAKDATKEAQAAHDAALKMDAEEFEKKMRSDLKAKAQAADQAKQDEAFNRSRELMLQRQYTVLAEKYDIYVWDCKKAAEAYHTEFADLWSGYKFKTTVIKGATDIGSVNKMNKKQTAKADTDNKALIGEMNDAINKFSRASVITAGKLAKEASENGFGKKFTIKLDKQHFKSPAIVAKYIEQLTDEKGVQAINEKYIAKCDALVKTYEKMFKIAVDDQQRLAKDGKVPGSVQTAVQAFGADLSFTKTALRGTETIAQSNLKIVAYNLGRLAVVEKAFATYLKFAPSVKTA